MTIQAAGKSSPVNQVTKMPSYARQNIAAGIATNVGSDCELFERHRRRQNQISGQLDKQARSKTIPGPAARGPDPVASLAFEPACLSIPHTLCNNRLYSPSSPRPDCDAADTARACASDIAEQSAIHCARTIRGLTLLGRKRRYTLPNPILDTTLINF